MADPTFRPGFHHRDWIDNVDPVVATGSNGFNSRFDSIAGDLHRLSTVVTEIDAAIDLLADPGSGATISREPTILVPIDLQSTPSPGPPAVGGWTYDANGVSRPTVSAGGARATMGIALPNGIQITSLRIVGGFDVGAARLIVQLGRAQLNLVIQAPDILATIDSVQQSFANPYDVEVLTNKQLSTVDLTRFRYFLSVNATGVPAPSQTSLVAVQLGFAGASTD
jgi:hypothetical protein